MGNIYDGEGNKCPVCGRKSIEINSCGDGSWYRCYTCPDCGEFFAHKFWGFQSNPNANDAEFLEKLKIYLFYHKSHMRPFICPEEEYNKMDKTGFVYIYNLSPTTINAWYPKTFAEKIDLILTKLADMSEYDGAYISVDEAMLERLFFCKERVCKSVKEGCDKKVQVKYILDFLTENKYVEETGNSTIQLLPKGLERIYELRKSQTNNRNVFVSMAFNEGTLQTREAIRKAIVDSEYSPEFIDEIIHNKQIVPEMFRLIRECRFLILDISDPNYGAYYEAGYALGLGKEVIICCSEEVFTKDFGSESKYRKPHFDIAQKQLLIWKDHSDLSKKLTEWIKAIVG